LDPIAHMARHVCPLRGDRDPMALMVTDFEAELLLVPFGGLLCIRDDQCDRCQAHAGPDSVGTDKGDVMEGGFMGPDVPALDGPPSSSLVKSIDGDLRKRDSRGSL